MIEKPKKGLCSECYFCMLEFIDVLNTQGVDHIFCKKNKEIKSNKRVCSSFKARSKKQ